MPMTIEIDKATVRQAKVQKVELIDRITLDGVELDKLRIEDLRLDIKPARVVLKGLRLTLELSVQVEVSYNPPGPGQVGPVTIGVGIPSTSIDLPDIELPSGSDIQFSLSLSRVEQGPLTATMDPILASQVPAILASLIVESIETGRIKLPTAGFDLSGLGLGGMSLQGLSLPGLQVEQTTLGRISAEGGIPVPRLALSGLTLGPSSAGTLSADGTSLDFDLDLPSKSESAAGFTVKLSPGGKATFRLRSLRMEDVTLSGRMGSIVLEGLDLRFDARGLRVSPIEVEDVLANEITLATAARTQLSPVWGGSGGAAFRDEISGIRRIARVALRGGHGVDALQVWFERTDGSVVAGPARGGPGGTASILDLGPNESITAVEGQYNNVVNHIELKTSLGRRLAVGRPGLHADVQVTLDLPGPVPDRQLSFRAEGLVPGQPAVLTPPGGAPSITLNIPADARPGQVLTLNQGSIRLRARLGAERWFKVEAAEILGFHGRSGGMLDAIGLYYR